MQPNNGAYADQHFVVRTALTPKNFQRTSSNGAFADTLLVQRRFRRPTLEADNGAYADEHFILTTALTPLLLGAD